MVEKTKKVIVEAKAVNIINVMLGVKLGKQRRLTRPIKQLK